MIDNILIGNNKSEISSFLPESLIESASILIPPDKRFLYGARWEGGSEARRPAVALARTDGGEPNHDPLGVSIGNFGFLLEPQ
jgi:hypothetical protein